MSDVTTAAEEIVFVPKGRPVLRFVIAIAVLAAALAAIWVTGLFNPRVELTVESWQHVSPGQAVFHVRDRGMVEARVRVVDVDDRFVHLAEPGAAVRVPASKSRRLTVRYTIDCAGYDAAKATPAGATTPELRLVLRVRGPIGPDRERRWPGADEVTLGTACGDPLPGQVP